MKNAVLIMKRASLAQGLVNCLSEVPDLQLFYEPDYTLADTAIREHLARVALLEVSESGGQDADYCLGLCGWLRERTPDCRLLLMCPESDHQAIRKAVQARRDRLIDDFVFYDVSMDYLLTKLRAL